MREIIILFVGFAMGMICMRWLVMLGGRKLIDDGRLAIRFEGKTKGNLDA